MLVYLCFKVFNIWLLYLIFYEDVNHNIFDINLKIFTNENISPRD